jgi:hypothetical protein
VPVKPRQPEDRAALTLACRVGPDAGEAGLTEPGLARELERDLDNRLDVVRGQAQRPLCLLELIVELLDLLAQATLEGEHLAHWLGPALGAFRLETAPASEHGFLDLGGDHRAHRAEIAPDPLHLHRGAHEELEITVELARRERLALGAGPVPRPDEVVDEHLIGLLAVAVHAAIALLHAVRVPRDLVVDQPRAMVLEVDSLGSRVGGQQDAHRCFRRICLEGGLDALAGVFVHAAVEGQEALARGQPVRGEEPVEPVLCGPVLGEDDGAPIGPGSAGPDGVLQPADQFASLGVRLFDRGRRPLAHLAEETSLFIVEIGEETGGPFNGIHGRFFLGLVVPVLLIHPVDQLAEQPVGGCRGGRGAAAPSGGERAFVLGERGLEGRGGGE